MLGFPEYGYRLGTGLPGHTVFPRPRIRGNRGTHTGLLGLRWVGEPFRELIEIGLKLVSWVGLSRCMDERV